MKTNLWKVYKQFYQRSYRNPDNDLYVECENIAHEIIANKLTKEEIIHWGEILYELEKKLRVGKYFSKELIDAVKNDNYEIDIPYAVRHKYQSKEWIGYIYIFTSKNKPNQSKLGATTLRPEVRAAKYTSKYFYKADVFYYKEVNDPFSLESKIKKIIIDKRVHGNLQDDSIEWYFIEPEELKKIIEVNLIICQ